MRAEAKSLRFLGEGKKIKVPFFQRSYVWKEENWEELISTFQNKEVKPFLGSLIIKHISHSEDYIIDGQQRLTTVTILAKAIYDSLDDDKKQSGIRSEIENLLFYKDNSADDFCDSHVKIEHSRLDYNDYETVIKTGLLDEKNDISLDKIDKNSSKILLCYKYYMERLKDYSKNELKELFNSLFNEDRKVFVLIELDYDDVNEQSIFDTINRACVQLNAADIIKNNLFKRLSDAFDSDKESVLKIYCQNWEDVFQVDSQTSMLWDEERVFGNIQHTNLEFLLYCVACIKWGEDKDLFPHLAKVFDKQTLNMGKYELIELIADIKKYAELFKEYILDLKNSLEADDSDMYFKYDNYITRLLLILQKFKIQMFYPYVLKRLFETNGNSEDDDLKHDFLVLESFIMRRKISSRGTQDYTTKCYDIINNGVERLFNNNESGISDSEVFQALSITKDDAATMILFWIELYLRKKRNYDVLALNFDFTLEHIMPRKWEKYWSNIEITNSGEPLKSDSDEGKKFRNDHIQSIGNKTLLSSRLNTTVRNLNFMDKINGKGNETGYKNNTGLILTKEIVDNSKKDPIWDEAHIDFRQQKIFDLFLDIWPYFNSNNDNNYLIVNNISDDQNSDYEKSIDDYSSDVFDDANKLLDAVTNISESDVYVEETEPQLLKNIFLNEVNEGKINYGYKPLFIKALIENANDHGVAFIWDIAQYFVSFYNKRRSDGDQVERQDSIMCKKECSIDDVINVIKTYPLKIYAKTQTVKYNPHDMTVSIVNEVWVNLTQSEKNEILRMCDKRLTDYYKNLKVTGLKRAYKDYRKE